MSILLIVFCFGCGGTTVNDLPKYAVNFMSDDSLVAQIAVNKNSSIGARRFPSPPVKPGYGFAGWSFSQSGTVAEFLPDSIVPEELVVYAVWMKEIFSASELEAIRGNLGGHYILTDDITLFDGDWEPIGTADMPFTGILDGAGHSIANLAISEKIESDTAGLFGVIKGAEIRNLTIDLAIIEISSPGVSAGIIAGVAKDSMIYKSTVSGIVQAASAAGGLAGVIYGGSVYACVSSVEATALNAGGLAGFVSGTEIYVSQSSGAVQAEAAGGGLVGVAQDTKVTSSYSTSDIQAQLSSGGIAGSLEDSVLSGVYATGSVATAFGGFYAGGIAGESSGNSAVEYSLSAAKDISGANTARISPSGVSLLNNYAYTATVMPRGSVSEINGADGEDTGLNVNRNFYTGADRVNKLNWDFNRIWHLPDSRKTGVLPLPVFMRGL